jgi:hypothetical protein
MPFGRLIGQEAMKKGHWIAKHPLELAFGNFSVGMPFTDVIVSKFYPFISLSTEFCYFDKKGSQILQSAGIGGFYNKYNTSGFFLNTNIMYRYTFSFGLFADAGLGAGYTQLFRPGAIYEQSVEGEYEQVTDWGKPSAMADFEISIGYDFEKKLQKPFSLFIRYGNYIQLFYNPDIPALPQNSLQIGGRVYIR